MRFRHPIKASSDREPALCDNTTLPYRQENRPPNRTRCRMQDSECPTYPIPCHPQTDTACLPGVLHGNYKSLSTTRVRLSYRYGVLNPRFLVDEPDTLCLHRSKGTIIIRRMLSYSPTFAFYRMPFAAIRYSMSNFPNMSSTNSDLLPAS